MSKVKRFVKDCGEGLIKYLFDVKENRKDRYTPVGDWILGWGSLILSFGSLAGGNTRLAADTAVFGVPNILIHHPYTYKDINISGIFTNLALAGGMFLTSRVFGQPSYPQAEYFAKIYGAEAAIYGIKGVAHLIESILRYNNKK